MRRVIIESPFTSTGHRERTHFVAYVIRNTVNNKLYIGITKRGLRRRANDHAVAARRGDLTPLHRAMAKYGIDKFKLYAVAEARTWNDLCALECTLIEQESSHVSRDGYNVTAGGEGAPGRRPSEETRAKIAEAARLQMQALGARNRLRACALRQYADPEVRKRVGDRFRGKTLTEEHKRKVSEAGRDRICSLETRAAIRMRLLGRPRPEHVRQILRTSMSGRKHTEASKTKMSIAHLGRPKSEEWKSKAREAWVRRKARGEAPFKQKG